MCKAEAKFGIGKAAIDMHQDKLRERQLAQNTPASTGQQYIAEEKPSAHQRRNIRDPTSPEPCHLPNPTTSAVLHPRQTPLQTVELDVLFPRPALGLSQPRTIPAMTETRRLCTRAT